MPAHRAQGGLSLSGGKLASSDLQRAKELFKELLSKSFVFPFIPYYFVLIFSLLSQVQTALRLLSGVTSEWAERNEKIWWQKIPLLLMKWQNKASKSSWCILNSTQMCIKAHVEDAKKLPKNIYIFNLFIHAYAQGSAFANFYKHCIACNSLRGVLSSRWRDAAGEMSTSGCVHT